MHIMQDALIIRNLNKRYTDFALQDLSLTLPRGTIMGFIGENGAGKTTTIKLILDLIKRDSGEILLLGQEPLRSSSMIREKIGVVMDEIGFPENMNAQQVNLILKKIYQTWDTTRFERYLEQFQLPVRKSIKEYSRGMKMKLGIAVALSHDSELLILDEATSGLDPIVREEILDVFQDFIQDEQKAVFISSHIISDLEKICDYITYIHQGKLVFSQNKEELKDQYGILHCTESQWQALDPTLVHGFRKNNFGMEVLVRRDLLQGDYVVDPASIEEIMIFYAKENLKK